MQAAWRPMTSCAYEREIAEPLIDEGLVPDKSASATDPQTQVAMTVNALSAPVCGFRFGQMRIRAEGTR
jgi:hypothetical protein